MDPRKLYYYLRDRSRSTQRYVESVKKRIPHWNTRAIDHPPIFRYGLAILLCFLALAIKQIINPIFGTTLAFTFFYATILISTWYGGFGPGMCATILSGFLGYFVFFHPISNLPLHSQLFTVLFFMIEGSIIARLGSSMHKAFQQYEEKDRYVRYYANIAQNIFDAVISTDMDNIIQSWNKGAEALYGWDSDEVIGVSLGIIIPTTYVAQQKKEIDEHLEKHGYWKGEVIHKRKNGSRIHILTSISHITGDDGRPLGIVLVNRDISDRKKLEQGKDDFIALASHELKTPLTSTKLYVDILKQRFEQAHDKKDLSYIQKIDTQIKKLLELVKYLLDVSKVQAGKLQFTMEETSLDRFVMEVVRDIQQITPSHTFYIEDRTDKVVEIDKDRVRQVLVNLLNNAVKYSAGKDRIEISLQKNGSQAVVGVKDFGIGIPKEKQDKIFDRFYQVSDSKGYTYAGMGLGLYIAREIIEKHKGKLWVESEEGKGSTFYISFPSVRK